MVKPEVLQTKIGSEFRLAIFLSIIFFSCSKSETNADNSQEIVFEYIQIPNYIVNRNDSNLSRTIEGVILYKNEAFTGYLVEYYSDSTIKTKEGYYNGLKENISTSFYRNRNKRFERPYHLGKKHGMHIGWFDNKQINYERYFVNGKNEGEHKEYYPNGQLYKLQHYVDGNEFGSQKVWRPDGKIRANYVIREDGKKYGLMGLKRCNSVDVENEKVNR